MSELDDIIEQVVQSLVERLKTEFEERIESIFIAGSYASRTYSRQSPNVNLYVISKSNESSEMFIPIGRIFFETKELFATKLNITADLRPYRFACFSPQKGKPTLSVRMNLFDMKDRESNFMVPDYVLRGWAKSQKVLFGTDVLSELKIRVGMDRPILEQKRFILLTIMQQLKHIPLSYNWMKEPELLFHESYEFAKYTLSEGLLLKMDEKEIERGLDVEIYENKSRFVAFYSEKYGEPAAALARKVLDAREHYLEWKDEVSKAIEMYGVAWQVWRMIWGTLMQMLRSPLR